MIGNPRIGLTSLAALCRRLAVATNAGLDDRAIWARESEHGSPRLRSRLRQVRDGVAAGEAVDEALSATGMYFPLLLREMVTVGQHTGRMGGVWRRLADHYEHQVKLRRIFLTAIAWPMIQLVVAAGVVGLLIWIMPALGGADLLGFGPHLMGTSGLLIYAILVVGSAGGVLLLVEAVRRGAFWARPIQRAVLRIPVVGPSLRTIALARLTWTLHLTLNVEMDLRRLLPIALRSTGNDTYRAHTDSVVADITAGREIHQAFRRTGAFPDEFLQQVEVAERSGRLVESMGHMSRQYEEQAQAALGTLAVVAGFAVWALVAAVIILLIFRLFSFYVDAINSAGTV